MKSFSCRQKGFTFIEGLIYIAMLAFMMTIVIASLVGISRVYRQVRIIELVHSNASTIVEQIAREIRISVSTDIAGSIFDSDNGILKLNSVDLNGDNKTVTFSLNSGRVELTENATNLGPITSNHATVSSLYFEHINDSSAEAIKFSVTLSVGTGEYQKTETFYDTVVLRGSYDI